jgi:hypothetical protein
LSVRDKVVSVAVPGWGGEVVVGVGSLASGEGKVRAGAVAEGAWWCSSGVCCCGNGVPASSAWGGVVRVVVSGSTGCHQWAWVGQLAVVGRASQVSGAVEVIPRAFDGCCLDLGLVVLWEDFVLTWRRWLVGALRPGGCSRKHRWLWHSPLRR